MLKNFSLTTQFYVNSTWCIQMIRFSTGHTDFPIDCSWRRRTWSKCPTNYVFHHQIYQKRIHNFGCYVQTSAGKCCFNAVRTLNYCVHEYGDYCFRVFVQEKSNSLCFSFKNIINCEEKIMICQGIMNQPKCGNHIVAILVQICCSIWIEKS